jgi:hypothetical protein
MSTIDGTKTMLEPAAKLVTSPPPMVDMHTAMRHQPVSRDLSKQASKHQGAAPLATLNGRARIAAVMMLVPAEDAKMNKQQRVGVDDKLVHSNCRQAYGGEWWW